MKAALAPVVLTLGLLSCTEPCDTLDVGALCGARAASLPVLRDTSWPVVAGEVSGRKVTWLIDTGAGATVVSARLLGVAEGSYQRVDSLCVGELCIDEALVLATDNAIVQAEPSATQVHGLIGAPLLRHTLLELDRGASVRLDFDGQACTGRATPLRIDEHGRPFAEVSLDGQPIGSVLLDTGARYSVLSAQTMKGLASYVRERAMPASTCTVRACSDTAFLSTVRELCVGSSCAADAEVKFPVWDAVGATFFARARYQLDLRAAQLIACD